MYELCSHDGTFHSVGCMKKGAALSSTSSLKPCHYLLYPTVYCRILFLFVPCQYLYLVCGFTVTSIYQTYVPEFVFIFCLCFRIVSGPRSQARPRFLILFTNMVLGQQHNTTTTPPSYHTVVVNFNTHDGICPVHAMAIGILKACVDISTSR